MKNKFILLFYILLIFNSCIQEDTPEDANVVYTCSMDPQVREHHPGKCPICHMELTRVNNAMDKDEHVIRISDAQKVLANIKTEFAEPQSIGEEKILNAVVTVNQNLSSAISSKVEGRIEKLLVKSTGEKINKGQEIYELYSEQLISAQKDYLVALKHIQNNSILGFDYKKFAEASRQKLIRWKMTEIQIQHLEKNNEIQNFIPVYAEKSGIVSDIFIKEGDYVMEGDEIFKLSDYSSLWVEAQLYTSEVSDLSSITEGEITFPGYSDTIIKGKISFMNPELLPNSKFIIARIEILNSSSFIRPGMQATITIRSNEREVLAIPATAIIHDKQGDMVWLKKSPKAYEPRMVQLGRQNNKYVEVLDGLEDGDAVVTSGSYLLQSEYIFKKGSSPMQGMAGMEEMSKMKM